VESIPRRTGSTATGFRPVSDGKGKSWLTRPVALGRKDRVWPKGAEDRSVHARLRRGQERTSAASTSHTPEGRLRDGRPTVCMFRLDVRLDHTCCPTVVVITPPEPTSRCFFAAIAARRVVRQVPIGASVWQHGRFLLPGGVHRGFRKAVRSHRASEFTLGTKRRLDAEESGPLAGPRAPVTSCYRCSQQDVVLGQPPRC
jgi:hypothetical protein